MPKWTYFVTVECILSAESKRCSDMHEVSDGTLLQWDHESKCLSAWGTPLWWYPHDLVASMLTNVGSNARIRLAVSAEGLHGFHLDINTARFFDTINSSGEVAVCRLVTVYEHNVCCFHTPPVLLDAISPNMRKCRQKLTPHQLKAVEWMKVRETFSGGVSLRTGIPVQGTNLRFSSRDHMFVETPQNQHIVVNAAALTGYRGTGKSIIVRELISTKMHVFPVATPYVYHSNLVVVPDHLVEQWTGVLGSPRVVDDDFELPQTEPVVLISYSTLSRAVRCNQELYPSSIVDHISRRKGIRTRTLVSAMWDRIIVDEFCSSPSMPMLLKHMSSRFLWALQGGTSTRDEMNIVHTLYSPETAFGDILGHVVYNYLPVVVPVQIKDEQVVSVDASCDEICMMESIGGVLNWVYPQYNKDLFHVRDTLDATLEVDVDEPCSVQLIDTDAWLYPDDYVESNTLSVTVNGVEISIDLVPSVEEESETSEEEVVISEDFLNAQVTTLRTGEISQCAVCLDRMCDAIMGCGHTVCVICAALISRDAEPRCPHCRYRVTQICTVRRIAHSALDWLKDTIDLAQDNNEKIFVVGSNQLGVEHIRKDIPCVMHSSDLNGKVETDVTHVITLDDAVIIPATLSHPTQHIRVTKLQVKLPTAAT